MRTDSLRSKHIQERGVKRSANCERDGEDIVEGNVVFKVFIAMSFAIKSCD